MLRNLKEQMDQMVTSEDLETGRIFHVHNRCDFLALLIELKTTQAFLPRYNERYFSAMKKKQGNKEKEIRKKNKNKNRKEKTAPI